MTVHYVHNGGMTHALPNLDVSTSGTTDPSQVTCPTCLSQFGGSAEEWENEGGAT